MKSVSRKVEAQSRDIRNYALNWVALVSYNAWDVRFYIRDNLLVVRAGVWESVR